MRKKREITEFKQIVRAEFNARKEMKMEYAITAELSAHWWLNFYIDPSREHIPLEPSKSELSLS
jgi:hypothetical protein